MDTTLVASGAFSLSDSLDLRSLSRGKRRGISSSELRERVSTDVLTLGGEGVELER